MAVLTNVACLDMRGALAGGIDSVMTANTIAADVRVIKQCRNPAVCLVTVIALFT